MVEKIFFDDYLAPDPRLEPPDRFSGRGIVVRNAKNITIRNAKIRGFKVAIYAENCPNLTIENCDVSNNYRQRLKSTPQREHLDDWIFGHENDNDEWLRYGAGIYLKNCEGATIRNCRARNGQNGICLVRCDKATVVGCDMSFMSGWGLAMWRSNFCKIIGNRFDYCVRGYSHGVYARGQDSAGILVYEQCSDNVFAYNHATHGGDGFFLYAGNETVNKTGEGGCNRNLVYANDFSYAVANGIEATFSNQNMFISNRLQQCEHGIWAGYSTNSLIACNWIDGCKYGVSIEHGRENRIIKNHFRHCVCGVKIWWDEDKDLLDSAYARQQGAESKLERLERNFFRECESAIEALDSTAISLIANVFEMCPAAFRGLGKASVDPFIHNSIDGGLIETTQRLIVNRNHLNDGVRISGPVERIEPLESSTELNAIVSMVRLVSPWTKEAEEMNIPVVANGEPKPPGMVPTSALPGILEGKQFILVDDWGPYDFTQPKVFPQNTTAWESTSVQVVGPPGETFKVTVNTQGVTAAPMSGKTPATVKISLAEGAKDTYVPFSANFQVGNTPLTAKGALLNANWDINYYRWDAADDPRDGQQAWRRIRAVEPFLRQRTRGIDFVWGSGGPTPEVTDHFATVAGTTMTLPAGKWRLRTISDDGVRVFVDGRKTIDNWTWHVPTEDTTEMTLPAGSHEFRIEYFEIDGHAQLQFFIEPADRSEP